MNEQQAYQQGAADCENGAGQQPLRGGDHWKAYLQGWYDAADYASESSLRYAESGQAYEDWLDARSWDGTSAREEEIERYLEGLNEEFDNTPRDLDEGRERDPFMALVLANGEEAKRESDRVFMAKHNIRTVKMLPIDDGIPF